MSVDACNGYLDAFASLNEGTDHACQYTFAALDDSTDVKAALSSLVFRSGRADWAKEIELLPVSAPWRGQVGKSVVRWFFEQPYSPSVKRPDFGQQNVVIGFMNLLASVVGEAQAFEVAGSPVSAGWAVAWEGYLFCNGANSWLLQFGWHD